MSRHIETHLPSYPTAFIGRNDEIADIVQRLNDPGCRLLTLVGPGGIGKTRLAIEASKCVPKTEPEIGALSFANGIYFVDLQPVSTSELVVTTIANALGVMLSGSETPREQLLTYLSTRNTLLILDNFEQLLNGVDLLADIVKHAPGIKLLVTSREALNMQEEWVWRVGGLQVPNHQPGTGIESYSAVQLFAERARHTRQDFSLAGQEAHVTHICQLVDGMPLALELAASWVKALACDEIETEIRRSLDFLTTNMRNMPERHRSMQAVFDHSWRLLTDEERAVFPKLSVFRGGFRREAAEQVAGASLAILAGLVEKSFLRLSGTGRHEVHELMRQYGEQQLEDADKIRDAHSRYYLGFVTEREADIKGRRQIEATNEIDADFENVRVAWLWAIDHNNREGIERVLECLHRFCDYRARLLEQKELLLRAQEQFAPQEGEMPLLIWARITLRLAETHVYSAFGDYGENQPLYEKALIVAERHNDRAEIAHSLSARGAALNTNEKPGSMPFFEKALNIYEELGDLFYISNALLNLAFGYQDIEQYDLAVKFERRSLDLSLQIGNKQTAASALVSMTRNLLNIGRYEEADTRAQQLTKLVQEIGPSKVLIMSYNSLSEVAFDSGDFDQVKALAEEGLRIAVDLNYPMARVGVLFKLLFINCMVYENYAEAWQFCQEVILYLKRSDFMITWVETVMSYASGNYDLARQNFLITLKAGIALHYVRNRLHLLSTAALLLAQEGDKERAAELLGLIFNHPATAVRSLEKWPLVSRLRATMQVELGEAAYAAAWKRGASLDLETVERSLLDRWEEENKPQPLQQLIDALTPRELEVLRLVATGHSNRQIARELILTVGTVKTHIHNIYGKLGVEGRVQATTRARELHLL